MPVAEAEGNKVHCRYNENKWVTAGPERPSYLEGRN